MCCVVKSRSMSNSHVRIIHRYYRYRKAIVRSHSQGIPHVVKPQVENY